MKAKIRTMQEKRFKASMGPVPKGTKFHPALVQMLNYQIKVEGAAPEGLGVFVADPCRDALLYFQHYDNGDRSREEVLDSLRNVNGLKYMGQSAILPNVNR